MTVSYDAMPAARRARTILAVANQCHVSDQASENGEMDSISMLLCAHSGSVFFLYEHKSSAPEGVLKVQISAAKAKLGKLILEGHLGSPERCGTGVKGSEVSFHQSQSPDACPNGVWRFELLPTRVMIEIEGDPGADIKRARTLVVDRAEFSQSAPDFWSLDLTGLHAHIEGDHQDQLLNLFTRHAPKTTTVDPFVCIESIDRNAIHLVCIDEHGSEALSISYGAEFDHPNGVLTWLGAAS
jgi:hypothetical protein